MSKLHDDILKIVNKREIKLKGVFFYLIGLDDEIIAKYRFTPDEFNDRKEIYTYTWYIRDNVLFIHGTITEPVIDISQYIVWKNDEGVEHYNKIRKQILDDKIANLSKEFIEF